MRNRFRAQPDRGATREEGGSVDGQRDFGEDGFDARLAGFPGDDVGDPFTRVEQDVTQALEKEQRSRSDRAAQSL